MVKKIKDRSLAELEQEIKEKAAELEAAKRKKSEWVQRTRAQNANIVADWIEQKMRERDKEFSLTHVDSDSLHDLLEQKFTFKENAPGVNS